MIPAEPIITDAAASPQALPPARLPGLRLAILAGLLLWMANPPLGCWPLAWFAITPLLVSVTRARHGRQAFWRGYVFGWAFLGPVWYWIGLTISNWLGGSPLGWCAWVGLTAILAGFYGAWGLAAWWLWRRTSGAWRWLGLAAAWIVMEYCRTLGALTMPWSQLSYTQYRFLPIVQVADITGAYGVSFLLMLMNVALTLWWLEKGKPGAAKWILRAAFAAILVCVYGLARLAQSEGGREIVVASIQNNYRMFAPPRDAQEVLQQFDQLTRQVMRSVSPAPSLIVWPESSAPGDALNDLMTLGFLSRLARTNHAAILVGTRIDNRGEKTESNASLLFPPDGGPPQRYNKRQLVPFGEFIPFRGLLSPFASTFQFPTADVTPGVNPTTLRFTTPSGQTVAVGPFICYEAMYPPYTREMARQGANLLATQSNDDWFPGLAAKEQHLAAVVFRAVENRRSVVRSTTTGITCLLDSRGRVIVRAPMGKVALLVQPARLREEITPYTRFGDWFVLVCAGITLAAGLKDRKRG